jgi:hypothetical protein
MFMWISLYPRPSVERGRKDGLVHTDCACARLYSTPINYASNLRWIISGRKKEVAWRLEEFTAQLASWRLCTKVLEVWRLCAQGQAEGFISNFTGRLLIIMHMRSKCVPGRLFSPFPRMYLLTKRWYLTAATLPYILSVGLMKRM